jgi:hypothetical protein
MGSAAAFDSGVARAVQEEDGEECLDSIVRLRAAQRNRGRVRDGEEFDFDAV